MRRIASLLLLIGFVSPTVAQSRDVDPSELARGLRENGLTELAVRYIDEVLAKDKRPEVVAVVPLEEALLRLERAKEEVEEGKRTLLIEEAKRKLNHFRSEHGNHPRAAEAQIALGRLIALQARGLYAHAKRYGDASKRQAEIAKTRRVFLDAVSQLDAAPEEYKRLLTEPGISSSRRSALQREEATIELERARTYYELARTYEAGNDTEAKSRRGDAYSKSLELFTKLNDKLSARPANRDPATWIAKAWCGQCRLMLQDPTAAARTFTELRNTRNTQPLAIAGARLGEFFRLAREYEEVLVAEKDFDGKSAALITALEEWLNDPALKTLKPTPELYAARFYVGVLKEKKAMRLCAREKDNTITYPIPKGAADLLRGADAAYGSVLAPFNDYAERGAEARIRVRRHIVGNQEKPPGDYKDFRECLEAAQTAQHRMKEAKDEAERKTRAERTVALYNQLLTLEVPKGQVNELQTAYADAAYVALFSEKQDRALAFGERGLALGKAGGAASARSGLYAMQACWNQAVARGVNASTERQADMEKMRLLGANLEQLFPDDPSTDSAREMLGIQARNDHKLLEAYDLFSRVKSTYPHLDRVRLNQSVAAFDLIREKEGPNALPADKRAALLENVIEQLSSVPDLAESAGHDDANIHGLLKLQLVELLLLTPSNYERAAETAATAMKRVQSFTELPAEEKAELYNKIDLARLRAHYGIIMPLFQARQFPEANQRFTPLVDDFLKRGPAVDPSAARPSSAAKRLDDFRRDAILVRAIQARMKSIQADDLDRVLQMFELLKKLGSGADASDESLFQVVDGVRKQIETLRHEKKGKEADDLVKNVGIVLDKIAEDAKATPKTRLNIAYGMRITGNYDRALEQLKAIPLPAKELLNTKASEMNKLDENARKELGVYQASRLELVRTYRQSGKITEAEKTLDEAMGPDNGAAKPREGWAATRIEFRREAVHVLEAKAESQKPPTSIATWKSALARWNTLADEPRNTLLKVNLAKKDPRKALEMLVRLGQNLPPHKALPDRAIILKDLGSPKPNDWLQEILADNEFTTKIKNDVARFEPDFRAKWHDLLFEHTRCRVAAIVQIAKEKEEEKGKKLGEVAQFLVKFEAENPEMTQELEQKFITLIENEAALKKAYKQAGGKMFLPASTES